MSDYTPGPWTHSGQIGGPGHCFCAQVWDASDKSLAVLATTANPSDANANARLIAAAPDLLEACKAFIAADNQCGIALAFDMAEKAIAKATGANQ